MVVLRPTPVARLLSILPVAALLAVALLEARVFPLLLGFSLGAWLSATSIGRITVDGEVLRKHRIGRTLRVDLADVRRLGRTGSVVSVEDHEGHTVAWQPWAWGDDGALMAALAERGHAVPR